MVLLNAELIQTQNMCCMFVGKWVVAPLPKTRLRTDAFRAEPEEIVQTSAISSSLHSFSLFTRGRQFGTFSHASNLLEGT